MMKAELVSSLVFAAILLMGASIGIRPSIEEMIMVSLATTIMLIVFEGMSQ